MTWPTTIRPYLNQAYLLGLLMVAVGLTLSPFLMGMSQFWLVAVWLIDALIPARHCGPDPQSPVHLEYVFALGRWRMFLRHDGVGHKGSEPQSFARHCKNIQKKHLSRGMRLTTGSCPYFF